MTTTGAIIMIISVGTSTLLFAWCIWKVLSTPGESEHIHGYGGDLPEEEKE